MALDHEQIRRIEAEARRVPNPWVESRLRGPSPRLQPLALLDPTKWTEPPPEQEWIVPDWIPRGYVTALYGDGAVGKSLLVQQLLTSVAMGMPWCGLDVTTAGRALGVFCEDDVKQLKRRQAAINSAYRLVPENLENLRLISRLGEDNILMRVDFEGPALTDLHASLLHTCEQFQPRLLVLDTAADLFGGNENDRGQVRLFVQQALGHIARRLDCSVLLCAHPSVSGMSNGTGAGGSTAWNNTVRSRLYLTREENQPNSNARTLSRKKANYAGAGSDIHLLWQDGTFDVTDRPLDEVAWPLVAQIFDSIEEAWTARRPWSHAKQARAAGRYFADHARDRFNLSEKQSTELIAGWLRNQFLVVEEYDKRNGKNSLRVIRRVQPADQLL